MDVESVYDVKIYNGKKWKIKSIQSKFYVICCVEIPTDIRRISFKGWEELKDA